MALSKLILFPGRGKGSFGRGTTLTGMLRQLHQRLVLVEGTGGDVYWQIVLDDD